MAIGLRRETIDLKNFEYLEHPWPDGHSNRSWEEFFAKAEESDSHGRPVEAIGMEPSREPGAGGLDAGTRDEANEEHIASLIAAERQRAEETGRLRGVEIGTASGREEAARKFDAERSRLQSQAASLLERFAETRDSFLQQMDQEVARLALAIASRILRREAQMDPLFLTGAVRVALGQLAESTVVRLRVPKRDEEMWEEAMALIPKLTMRPQVVRDEQMELGECRIETELGSADLGVWSQLKEIERSFFDRVEGHANLPAEGIESEKAADQIIDPTAVVNRPFSISNAELSPAR
jgi:flagellar biosynthesis/type III secretory pathway protein FliH